ncbi:MAG: CDP-alcohol phosphatidyltransferase family protein [Steroidobacteraceae bacterium]
MSADVLRHLPNAICLLRMVLTVPTVLALQNGDHGLALVWFAVAAASDGIDGFLAKRFGWTSELGRVLDPLADKILLVAVFMTCVWHGLVPVWLATAAIARDILITAGAITFRLWFGEVNGRPTLISKANTALQIVFLLGAIITPLVALDFADELQALAIVTFVTTVLSGADYTWRFLRVGWTRLEGA